MEKDVKSMAWCKISLYIYLWIESIIQWMIYVHICKNIRSLPFLLQQMLEDIVLDKLEFILRNIDYYYIISKVQLHNWNFTHRIIKIKKWYRKSGFNVKRLHGQYVGSFFTFNHFSK